MNPRVGFVGLGKLGLPVALAIAANNFEVCGTDLDIRVKQSLIDKRLPYKEVLADALLKNYTVNWSDNIAQVVRNSDVIFMPVQTPHDRMFEGITRLPAIRKDFNYYYLRNAVQGVVDAIAVSSDPSPKTLVIISTVLPGTIRREIMPLLAEVQDRIVLIYNPFFIAMGTVIRDFLDPEFVLLGMDNPGLIPGHLMRIYTQLYRAVDPGFYQVMSIESAELTKVAYNTFITSKICIANTLMEICHKVPGADIDAVTGALKQANRRIVSARYMDGGMGDGGGCHPRDNIAMSWLARELGLSYDWFAHLMISREKQAEFFADLICTEYREGDLIIIYGYTFKPETNLTTGSHALLVHEILQERRLSSLLVDLNVGYPVGHSMAMYSGDRKIKTIYFIGCKHAGTAEVQWPHGSVVIDPFRYIADQPGVKVIRVGEGK